MKTKIGQDETIPDDLLQVIHQSISTEQNGRNIDIPLYYQLHQANVCVICDRFITGTGLRKTLSSNTKQDLPFQILIVNSKNVTKFQILICMNCYYHQ
jgi:hypothetical protein